MTDARASCQSISVYVVCMLTKDHSTVGSRNGVRLVCKPLRPTSDEDGSNFPTCSHRWTKMECLGERTFPKIDNFAQTSGRGVALEADH